MTERGRKGGGGPHLGRAGKEVEWTVVMRVPCPKSRGGGGGVPWQDREGGGLGGGDEGAISGGQQRLRLR